MRNMKDKKHLRLTSHKLCSKKWKAMWNQEMSLGNSHVRSMKNFVTASKSREDPAMAKCAELDVGAPLVSTNSETKYSLQMFASG